MDEEGVVTPQKKGSPSESPSASSSLSSAPRHTPPFAVDCVPTNIRTLEYAIRGKVLDRAMELEREMLTHEYNFDKLLRCHLGNPHAVGTPALTYIREIVSLLLCPAVFDQDAEQALLRVYKPDSLMRARMYRQAMGEPGAYTHSQGAACLREEVASFFERRDGFKPNIDTIYLCNGASDAISTLLSVIVGGPKDGVLLPRPQYPLYSATMCRLNGHVQFYDLDEDLGWKCTEKSINSAWHGATSAGIDVKAIVIINPGNPAPTVLDYEDIEKILKLAAHHNMAVIADEVYQDNIYCFEDLEGSGCEARAFVGSGEIREKLHHMGDVKPEERLSASEIAESAEASSDSLGGFRQQLLPGSSAASPPGTFIPFRKVLKELNLSTQLVSLHSSSKGFYGECGFRGGLMQVENLDRDSQSMIYKMRSIELCSNTIGQVCMALVVTPPKPGQPSYLHYMAERSAALNDLAEKARLTTEFFNSLENTSCELIKGALYAFPQIRFSKKALQEAQERGISPELRYCLDLLNKTGIVSVPGDAFGQAEGTHHIRLTILPRLADLRKAFCRYRKFHEEFMRKTADVDQVAAAAAAFPPVESRSMRCSVDGDFPCAICTDERPPIPVFASPNIPPDDKQDKK